jgi:heat shock protein HslJ
MNRVKKIIIALGCILFISSCISRSQQFQLSGTRWILQSLHGHELLKDTAITLKITEGGFSGTSGCNFYGAKYATHPRNRIEIGEAAHTDMACLDPAGVMEQENEYLSAFPIATSYSVDGENLFIADKQGSILLKYRLLPKFVANPEGLKGETWRLIYTDGMEPDGFGAFTIWFDEGTFRGMTSCRDYKGTYQTDEDNIHIDILEMTTDVDCSKREQNAEGTYTSLLQFIDQYNVSQNQLELFTVKNQKLIYEPVPDN